MMRAAAVLIVSIACIATIGAASLIGRLIAPMSDVLAYASISDIWIQDVARGLAYNLTADTNVIIDKWPSWSPDGRQIAFGTIRNSPNSRPHSEIAVIDIATREIRLLTDGTSWDDSPAWSPDGRWIAFRSDRDADMGMGVFLIDMENPFEPPRLLTRAQQLSVIPSWSPDGKSVVMTPIIGDMPQVIAIDIESGIERLLLADIVYYPQMSPDGMHLAGWVLGGEGYALAVGPIGGPLVAMSQTYMNPPPFAWSPDSRTIVYGSAELAGSVFKQIDVETGTVSLFFPAPGNILGVAWRR